MRWLSIHLQNTQHASIAYVEYVKIQLLQLIKSLFYLKYHVNLSTNRKHILSGYSHHHLVQIALE